MKIWVTIALTVIAIATGAPASAKGRPRYGVNMSMSDGTVVHSEIPVKQPAVLVDTWSLIDVRQLPGKHDPKDPFKTPMFWNAKPLS